MALKLLQSGVQPLGQFDMVDSYVESVAGGEIATLLGLSRVNSTSEQAAADVLDGYTNDTDLQRAGLTLAVQAGSRPLWLVDDGTSGYGTLFGQVIGTPTGLSTSGSSLGPHSAAASGKVTAWDKPGLYAVSLDAVDTDVSDGLQPTNSSCDPGAALYPMIDGKLTPTVARATSSGDVVGRFVEFETTAVSLVRTPASLIGSAEVFEHAVFSYRVE